MEPEINPYAPPTHADEPEAPSGEDARDRGRGCWREDGLLVIDKANVVLPDRCVVCNRATDHKQKFHFAWHPPGYYLLALAGWVLYLIVATFVRKHATVEAGLCGEHRAQRRMGLLLAGLGAAGSLGMFLLSAQSRTDWLMWISLLFVVVLPIIGLRRARVVKVSRIDDSHGWFKVGPAFLASLPDTPYEEPPRARKGTGKKRKKKGKSAAVEIAPRDDDQA